jgi:hypothetical protein
MNCTQCSNWHWCEAGDEQDKDVEILCPNFEEDIKIKEEKTEVQNER